MKRHEFDAAILGGGSAGYAAARTLADAGRRVAVVEGGREVGGLCILRGCMPTKALLHAADLRHAIEAARDWGISTGSVDVDIAALFARKDALVAAFAAYRREQLESGRFGFFRTDARFADPHTLVLDDGSSLTASSFVVATGSETAPVPLPALERAGFITSDDALRLERLPASLVVLGGGPVALEFAQFFARMGTRVTVVQRGPRLLRGTDPDAARDLEAALRREGIEIHTDTTLVDAAADADGSGKSVTFRRGDETKTVRAEEIFHGLGRRPRTAGIGADKAGIELRPSGHIVTDAHQRTTADHIFAAGDCCGPHEIVHLAVRQGEVAAGTILHPEAPPAMDYRLLTSVVFTDPAVATVGLTELGAAERGIPCIAESHPFNDHGKSMILGCREGFVKLLADPTTGELLGGACVGPQGGELIHEIVVALSQRMTAAQLAAVPHYHPTLAEIWTYPAEALAARVP